MARCVEKPGRQKVKIHFSDPSSTREYAITQAPTRDDAVQILLATAPDIDTVNEVQRFYAFAELNEFSGGGDCWDGVVHYEKNPNAVEMTFNISGSNSRFMYSRETVAGYNCTDADAGSEIGFDIPDFGKGIGWNGTSYDGVDVESARMEFTISKKFKASLLGGEYIATLFQLAQKVNDDTWTYVWAQSESEEVEWTQTLTFAKGSVRFRGASIKQDSDNNLDITYSFLYQRGLHNGVGEVGGVQVPDDNITIGDSEAIEMEGHQVLWIFFGGATNANHAIKEPKAVYVERVYDYANFDDLQLA